VIDFDLKPVHDGKISDGKTLFYATSVGVPFPKLLQLAFRDRERTASRGRKTDAFRELIKGVF